MFDFGLYTQVSDGPLVLNPVFSFHCIMGVVGEAMVLGKLSVPGMVGWCDGAG